VLKHHRNLNNKPQALRIQNPTLGQFGKGKRKENKGIRAPSSRNRTGGADSLLQPLTQAIFHT